MANVVLSSSKKPKKISFGRVLTYLVLILGTFFAIAPFLYMISTSLMEQFEATGGTSLIPRAAQWSNYVEAWQDGNLGEYFFNSVQIAVITVIGQMIFSTLAAYAFSRIKFPGRDFIFTVLLMTLMIPEAVTWIPNFLTVTWLGRVGSIPWINNWPALTVPFMASVFSIFLLRQFFNQIPMDLWDAAQIDGAGHFRFLLQVAIPLARPALLTVALFSFLGAWNSLAWPILVTTDYEWRPIAYGLSTFIEEAGARVHLQMAGSVITILPILVMYLFVQKQFTEGIATTGLKG